MAKHKCLLFLLLTINYCFSFGQYVKVEHRTLEQIYKAALAEGGKLVVYAGDNTQPSAINPTKIAFEKQFPNITVDIVTDFSTSHVARVDIQLANNSLVPDLVMLQTVQDIRRWKSEGKLLNYKPMAWNYIFPGFKDVDGAFTPTLILVFGTIVNTQLLPKPSDWPQELNDLLQPKYKNRLIAVFPNDDDAAMFGYKLAVQKYGYSFMEKLKAQNVTLVRDSSSAINLVATGEYLATPFGFVPPVLPNGSTIQFLLPKTDKFVFYALPAAILRNAKHKEAAKLFINWSLEKANQQQSGGWSVRMDVPPPQGYKQIWEYKSQSSNEEFVRYMCDRGSVERFRNEVGLYFGEVKGDRPTDPNNQLGVKPPM